MHGPILYPHCLMHDVRVLSVKHFTFRLIYRTRGPWACNISGVRIFKFRVCGIALDELDPLRNGSALMNCTALAHAAGPEVAWPWSVSRRNTFC